jgi:hypothetical protein
MPISTMPGRQLVSLATCFSRLPTKRSSLWMTKLQTSWTGCMISIIKHVNDIWRWPVIRWRPAMTT